jgi:hypothetical protein
VANQDVGQTVNIPIEAALTYCNIFHELKPFK